MPLTREWKQSSRRPAPKDWETSVSRPMRRPSPKKANTRKRLELMLTAAMDWALFGRRPTNIVSSMAMLIQPISARTSGMARWRVGRSSVRRVDQENMGNRSVYGGGSKEVKKERAKSKAPSNLVVGLHRAAVPARESYSAMADGEVTRWGYWAGSSID